MSTHIHPAVRGLVRMATTVSTVRWQAKLPAAHGHSPQLLPSMAANGVDTMDAQNAATGRIMVSRTGITVNGTIRSTASSASTPEMSRVMRAATAIRACGVQVAYSRSRAGSRRMIRPSTLRRGSGR